MCKITIEQVTNGVIIESSHPTEDIRIKTLVTSEKSELDYMENLTYILWEILGYFSSKHDKERLVLKRQKK